MSDLSPDAAAAPGAPMEEMATVREDDNDVGALAVWTGRSRARSADRRCCARLSVLRLCLVPQG